MNWRTLSLLLILANMLYWAWSAWIVRPEIVGLEDHRITDMPRLELVSQMRADTTQGQQAAQTKTLSTSLGSMVPEVDDVPVEQGEGPDQALADGQVAMVCKRIGAFVNENDAIEAATWLETEGIRTEKKIGMDMVWLGYWVYLPKYPNREAALQVVSELKEKGIKDMFIEIAEPNKNALSLGLYRQRSGAESRARQIKAQGYPARIGNKEREQAVFWLETRIEASREIPLQRLSAPSGQVSRIEIKDCE